jgi:hypothetical protein
MTYVFLSADYYNTAPYEAFSVVGFLITALAIGGFFFPIWYVQHTYRIYVYSDRVEQRSYFFPGIRNPFVVAEGCYTLYYSDLDRVCIPGHSASAIDFYRYGARSRAFFFPNAVSEHRVLIGTLLEVFPDHVEVTGKDKVIRYYRGEQDLSWWEF